MPRKPLSKLNIKLSFQKIEQLAPPHKKLDEKKEKKKEVK